MAAPYTDKGTLTNLFAAAYDRNMRLALRALPTFRTLATVKAVNQTNPGDSVSFEIYKDLAAVTSTLASETGDPTGVALTNPDRISVTLGEYGNFTVVTKLFEAFNLDPKEIAHVANILAYNQVDSVDAIVQTYLALSANTQVIRNNGGTLAVGSGSNVGITSSSYITSAYLRYAITKLRAAAVVPTRNGLYRVDIHPEVAHDLRAETGAGSWRVPKEYADQGQLEAGELGQWEGAFFVETPRISSTTDGAGAVTRVFNTFVTGQEAIAEAVQEEFHAVVDGVIVDPLRRKRPIGWYGIAGWNRFRPEALWNIRTTSSVHNT